MSFGFSVGDFVAVAGLFTQVVSALCEAGGSASQCQHITDKLRIVDQAIRAVNRLKPVEGLEAALEATKTTALSCQLPLLEYLETIRKYDKSLGPGQMGVRLKIKWLVTKKLEAAMKLEAEIVVYLGIINLRLDIYKSMADTLEEQRNQRKFESLAMIHACQDIQIQTISAQAEQNTRDIQKDIRESSKETSQALMNLQQACFGSVSEFSKTAGTLSKVTSETWSKVCEIHNTVLWIQSYLSEPEPDTRHTWFQEPMRWEDAYGRLIQIPVEFNYPMMEGALRGRFQEGRGKKLVERNQWQLFDPSSPQTVFSAENWEPFPGMKITMAMIIPQYDDQMVCPRLTCLSKSYTDALGGGKICSGCKTWFDSLPRSSSPPRITEIVDSEQYTGVSSETRPAKFPSKIARAAKSRLQAHDGDTRSDTESEIDEEDLRHLKNARVRLEGLQMCKDCALTFPTAIALRKHITSEHGAADIYICSFGFAGCTSTFASKNEWKRHVISQHLERRYWRCEAGSCINRHSDFSRKDLFTQHLRLMHLPFPFKNQRWTTANWNAEVSKLQTTALRVLHVLPSHTSCPVRSCGALFDGNDAWDKRMEHVGRHLERVAAGEEEDRGWCQAVDAKLLAWASWERIILKKGGIWVLNDGRGAFIANDSDLEDDSEDGDEGNSNVANQGDSEDGDQQLLRSCERSDRSRNNGLEDFVIIDRTRPMKDVGAGGYAEAEAYALGVIAGARAPASSTRVQSPLMGGVAGAGAGSLVESNSEMEKRLRKMMREIERREIELRRRRLCAEDDFKD